MSRSTGTRNHITQVVLGIKVSVMQDVTRWYFSIRLLKEGLSMCHQLESQKILCCNKGVAIDTVSTRCIYFNTVH